MSTYALIISQAAAKCCQLCKHARFPPQPATAGMLILMTYLCMYKSLHSCANICACARRSPPTPYQFVAPVTLCSDHAPSICLALTPHCAHPKQYFRFSLWPLCLPSRSVTLHLRQNAHYEMKWNGMKCVETK